MNATPQHEKDALGLWGEDIATHYLKKKGYKIAGRRVKSKYGELDIVAVSNHGVQPELVFVEVKTRRSHDFGGGVAALDQRKRQALCRSARLFLRSMRPPLPPYRFDLIEVIGASDNPSPEITHFERCFSMEKRILSDWF